MDDIDPRPSLRTAVLEGDAQMLLDLLGRHPWPEHALQWIGEGLVDALSGGVDGAAEPARLCIAALRERDWTGDDELADALEARLGTGPWPLLRPLPIDLEELSSSLEGDPMRGGGQIDLTTGEVWPQPLIESGELDIEDEAADDPDRWLRIRPQGSREGYRDMESFLEFVDDPPLVARLERALSGRGVFRRFKDVLADHSDLLPAWYAFSDERSRGRARRWLADEGYTPSAAGPAD